MNINKQLSIEETFSKAIEYHKNKKLDDAKKLYNEVIKKDPNHIRLNSLAPFSVIFSCIDFPNGPLFSTGLIRPFFSRS